jgi:hypothetical protein
MSHHTPGPWETIDGAEVFPTSGTTSYCPLARVEGPWSGSTLYANASEARANGRLIAAAPELLLLLVDFLVECNPGGNTYEPPSKALCDSARAIIDRATGVRR